MRVLVITNMYPPHHLGGYELSCRDVVQRFRERGHAVTILTSTFRRDDVADDGEEAGIRRELGLYWRDDHPWFPSLVETIAIERADRRALLQAVAGVRPDVLSLWNMGTLPLSLIRTSVATGLPIVHHACNDWPSLNFRLDGLQDLIHRHRLVGRIACRVAGLPTELPDVGASGRFCWVSSATWAAAEEATPWRFPRSTVVYSGISHQDFPPIDSPLVPRPWRGRLLYVGRLDGLKGVDAVIETVLRIDGTTAEIIGPGNPGYRDALLQRAADFGLRHRIRAMTLDRAALRQRYLAADALLFTSLHEPFGLVPIEAMACGTPVVASGAGGSAEFLVDEENCLLYPAGDFDALASTVRRLSSDDGLRLRLARNGLRVAHEFSVDRLADRLERAHLEAVEASGGARNSARIR